jgi:long-chain acyl-CoA synthetase
MQYKYLPLLIRDRISTYGDRAALGYKDKTLNTWNTISWNQMGDRVDAVAKALIDNQVSVQDMVGIFSSNMPEWILCDFALMDIRAVSVPIFSTDPISQVEYIIHETEMKLIFVGEQEQYDKILNIVQKNGFDIKIVVFDDNVDLKSYSNAIYLKQFYTKWIDHKDNTSINERLFNLEEEDIVTILYTSGTTGVPKGVVLRQRNFDSFLKIHMAFLTVLGDTDTTLTFLPLSHIFERAMTLLALNKGATVYFLSNPRGVVDALQVVKPTFMCTVPRFFEKTYNVIFEKIEASSFLEKKIFFWSIDVGKKIMNLRRLEKNIPLLDRIKYKLADKLVLQKGRQAFGGNIRYFPCSGAMLPDNINLFFQSAGIRIIYAYGLTETLATVTAYPYTQFKFGTVGKPLPFVEIKIGRDNEILIKDDSLFSEYYKKPEETLAAFEDGWFKSGDAGEIDADGNLIMLERIKDLIKTSVGKYVAPQQIECILASEPLIEQVVVIGDNRKYLTALIVPSFPALEAYAEKLKITFATREEMLSNSMIVKLMKSKLHAAQKNLANYQKVHKFAMLANEFSIDTGEFTSTLKMKRKIISQKYSVQIEKMYQE